MERIFKLYHLGSRASLPHHSPHPAINNSAKTNNPVTMSRLLPTCSPYESHGGVRGCRPSQKLARFGHVSSLHLPAVEQNDAIDFVVARHVFFHVYRYWMCFLGHLLLDLGLWDSKQLRVERSPCNLLLQRPSYNKP